jgi:hypothetical protein
VVKPKTTDIVGNSGTDGEITENQRDTLGSMSLPIADVQVLELASKWIQHRLVRHVASVVARRAFFIF